MNTSCAAHYATHATPEELEAVLGKRWAICRATPGNIERWGHCISAKRYAETVKRILGDRVPQGTYS